VPTLFERNKQPSLESTRASTSGRISVTRWKRSSGASSPEAGAVGVDVTAVKASYRQKRRQREVRSKSGLPADAVENVIDVARTNSDSARTLVSPKTPSTSNIERSISAPPDLDEVENSPQGTPGVALSSSSEDVRSGEGFDDEGVPATLGEDVISMVSEEAEEEMSHEGSKTMVLPPTLPARDPIPAASVDSATDPVPTQRESILSSQMCKEQEEQIQASFLTLNNQLLETLDRASRDGRLISKSELAEFGLHPTDDKFLRALVRALRLRVEFLNRSLCALLRDSR
jgi:hypothetical protein